jgi:hypothetical protein
MRACILEIIPGDVVEDAVNQIKETLRQAGRAEGPIEDRIKKMALAFNGVGVPVDAIEGRLGHNIDLTTEDELIDLLAIYNSLKDGVKKRTDFFAFAGGVPTAFADAKQAPAKAAAEPPVPKKEKIPEGALVPEAEKQTKAETKTEAAKEEEKAGPTGNATPTPEQMKANLQKDPFSCPKTGEPLGKVDCENCPEIATCQAMSGEANPPPGGAAKTAAPPPAEPPKEQKTRDTKKKDESWVCGYAKMEPLHGRSVYGKYCQTQCRYRQECPTLKEHGGPTK